jgi:hypothetical protein
LYSSLAIVEYLFTSLLYSSHTNMAIKLMPIKFNTTNLLDSNDVSHNLKPPAEAAINASTQPRGKNGSFDLSKL